MKETLEIAATVVRREANNTVYVEYHIQNLGIEQVAYLANTLPIVGSIAATVAADQPKARAEILKAVEQHFPGQYE